MASLRTEPYPLPDETEAQYQRRMAALERLEHARRVKGLRVAALETAPPEDAGGDDDW